MKNLLNPLKKILTSLTGEETKDKNIVAVVDKIADAVEDNVSDGGGISGNKQWNENMQNLVYVQIEPEDNNSASIIVFCVDGDMSSTSSIITDTETGKVSLAWSEWATNPESPVPDYNEYLSVLEANIEAYLIPCLAQQSGSKSFENKPIPKTIITTR